MAESKLYVNATEAAKLLGISRQTFYKLKKEKTLRRVFLGKRLLYITDEILKLVSPVARPVPDIDLGSFSKHSPFDLQTERGTFDLGRILSLDPFGVISLFCTFAHLAGSGEKLNLLVEDNVICNQLHSLGFFLTLKKDYGELINCDTSKLVTGYNDVSYPIPLTGFKMRRQEAPVVERLISLLRTQGFSEDIGGYIGWIIGELVDNSMTHLVYNGAPSECYILAQRYRFVKSKQECIIIGVGDKGPGIHSTLRRNPKYKDLTDDRSFLTAFKPKVSSWTDVDRGKGLTDILTIAMGNNSVVRAESSHLTFRADFRDKSFQFGLLNRSVPGTRFALYLIDKQFEPNTREQVAEFIDGELGKL